jgi:CheY-like chemotaxis protein
MAIDLSAKPRCLIGPKGEPHERSAHSSSYILGTEIEAQNVQISRRQFPSLRCMKFTDKIIAADAASKTILLVEDEAPTRLLMWHILEQAGYQVLLASDGIEGLQKLTAAIHIDLLLTDLSMPGMSGVELAQHAQRLLPHLKVLYASGAYDRFPEIDRAVGCLIKPFTVDELLEMVAETMKAPVLSSN